MTYTAPQHVSAGDIATAAQFNEEIVDSIAALYSRPSGAAALDLASNVTLASASSFTDIDGTNLTVTLTLDAAADVLMGFTGCFLLASSGSVYAYLVPAIDNTPVQANDGLVAQSISSQNDPTPLAYTYLALNVAAGTHTFRPQWKKVDNTNTPGLVLLAGAGTANKDMHPQFWVKQV